MIAEDRFIEIFRVMDGLVKDLHAGLRKDIRSEAPENGTRHGNRRGRPCEDGVMTMPAATIPCGVPT